MRGTHGKRRREQMRSLTATAAAGVVGSLLVSIASWWYFDTLAFLLVENAPAGCDSRVGDVLHGANAV
jgi:fatty acid desaturase